MKGHHSLIGRTIEDVLYDPESDTLTLTLDGGDRVALSAGPAPGVHDRIHEGLVPNVINLELKVLKQPSGDLETSN